ncbi:MAG: hypothetical protein JXB60_06880 [Candidatus Cloacimonetes bacterium]|nr:hypothetical protein [Candidatus Cloacimonadota bacterium]
MIVETSLAQTIENFEEKLFYRRPLTTAAKRELCYWLETRLGKSGSYNGMFAPTAKDFQEGIVLFSGDRVSSRAAIGHILGEEACRLLLIFSPDIRETIPLYKSAVREMLLLLRKGDTRRRASGFYCCGTCTCALWRHLLAGGFDNQKMRLYDGIKILKKSRDGKGGWKRFPYYYTLMTFLDFDRNMIREELEYGLPRLERLQKRKAQNIYQERRIDLIERLLERK